MIRRLSVSKSRIFLSTPSVGRATRGEGVGLANIYISIHALRGEGDGDVFASKPRRVLFLSTPSVGRATQRQIEFEQYSDISIHALRGEGDGKSA